MNKIMKMKKLMTLSSTVIIIILLLFTSSCHKNEYKIASKTYYLYLDTISTVAVEYNTKTITFEKVSEVLDHIDNILLNIEKEFSAEATFYMKNENIYSSTLMVVNENAGIKPVVVSKEFIDIIKQAKSISELTAGGFDPTIGPLTSLWDISSKAEYCSIETESSPMCNIPSKSEIDEVLPLIDYTKIEVNEEDSTVYLPKKGMKLDLGAIAKGYAADVVMNYLKDFSFEYISVNLGGNLIVAGVSNIYAARNELVSSEIENPFGGNTIISTTKTDMTIVSSGTYERYIMVNEKKYHHILDPKTGYPFENELMMVSIIGTSSCVADGLSTGVFSKGLVDGMELIKSIEGYSAFFITTDRKIYVVGDIDFNLTTTGENDFTLIRNN